MAAAVAAKFSSEQRVMYSSHKCSSSLDRYALSVACIINYGASTATIISKYSTFNSRSIAYSFKFFKIFRTDVQFLNCDSIAYTTLKNEMLEHRHLYEK